MNKKIGVLALVLVLAILAGSGFWFVKNQKDNKKEIIINKESNKEEIAAQDGNQEQKESDIEQADTSNWQTYKNKEYGFEFKYPANWIVEEDRNPTTYLADRLLEIRPEKIDENNKNLVFFIMTSASNSNPKEWYKTKYQNPDDIAGYNMETKELKINNLDTYYIGVYKDYAGKEFYGDNEYLISRNNTILRLTFRSEVIYGDGKVKFSYTDYLPYFKSLVYSIK